MKEFSSSFLKQPVFQHFVRCQVSMAYKNLKYKEAAYTVEPLKEDTVLNSSPQWTKLNTQILSPLSI